MAVIQFRLCDYKTELHSIFHFPLEHNVKSAFDNVQLKKYTKCLIHRVGQRVIEN